MTRGVTIRLARKTHQYEIVFQGKVLAKLDEETTNEILEKLKDCK